MGYYLDKRKKREYSVKGDRQKRTHKVDQTFNINKKGARHAKARPTKNKDPVGP